MGKFSFMDIMNEISTEDAGKGEMVEKVSAVSYTHLRAHETSV